jgi:lantibiotic leader peptide-processing serine protease
MHKPGILILTMLVLGSLVLALPSWANSMPSYVIEASGNLPPNLDQVVSAAGGTLARTHPEIGVAQASSSDPDFATKLAQSPGIQRVAVDSPIQWVPQPATAIRATVALANPPAAAPNPQGAFFFACQWNMQQLNAPGAWAQGAFGAPHEKVAVLDTGIDPNHIDLAGKVDLAESRSELSPGTSACGSADETSIFDNFFHGTFVSSQIVGNLRGMAAVAPRSTVVMVKVLDCTGSGTFGDVIAGIKYAATLDDVDVLNLSLGAYFTKQGQDALIDALDRVVTFARNRGKLVVVAAGNNGALLGEGSPNIDIPAQSKGATAIFATAIDRSLASYSNYGEVTWVGAGGGDFPDPLGPLPGCPINPGLQSLVLGACSSAFCGAENFYLVGAGTSFASPLAAGVAALLDGLPGDDPTPGHLRHVLARTAVPLGSPEIFSHGLIDAGKAVKSEIHGDDPGEDD